MTRYRVLLAITLIGLLGVIWLRPSTLPLTSLNTTANQPSSRNPEAKNVTETRVYKVYGPNGKISYTDQTPDIETDSETKTIRSDVNLSPAPVSTNSKPLDKPKTTPSSTGISTTNPYLNPQQVQQLMKDAKNVQNLMDERIEALDQQLEQQFPR